MDVHRQKLQHFCRICGKTRVFQDEKRQPYKVATFAKELKRAFSLDITQSDPDVLPPFLCNCCRLSLQRWYKLTRTRKSCKLSLSLYNFFPHSDRDCEICKFTLPSHHVPNGKFSSETVAKMVDIATAAGFHRVQGLEFVQLRAGADRVHYRISISVDDGSLYLEIHGKVVNHCDILNSNEVRTAEDFSGIIEQLKLFQICPGNEGFGELCESRRNGRSAAVFMSVTGGVVAFEEAGFGQGQTVRHVACKYLVKTASSASSKCEICSMYRVNLNALKSKLGTKDTLQSPDDLLTSKCRNDYLCPDQLKVKLKASVDLGGKLKRKCESLNDKLQAALEDQGLQLTDSMGASLASVLKNNEKTILDLPEDSPMKLIWQQQQQMLSRKSAKGMRWHPAIIKWCIALHKKSPAAYRQIRNSKILFLPHECTLVDYTQYTTAKSGWNPDIIEHIKKDIDFCNMQDFRRNVSLVFDEMKIKSGLVYSTSTGQLIGFTDLGDINNELSHFVRKVKVGESSACMSEPELATHVLAFMVRGIFVPMQEVFAFFPCSSGFTSNQLFFAVWDAVALLESAGFQVRAFIADGASPNRRFFRIHRTDTDEDIVFVTTNPFGNGPRIYFISDVPHLMKTTRNNWENSGWHNKTRNLHYNSQDIKWTQLLKLVEEDMRAENGLRYLNKIAYEHIYLTPSLRMKVNLAAQVLSASVANALHHISTQKNWHDTGSAVTFIRKMDRFFDLLNISNTRQGYLKPWMKPFTCVDDERFVWLEKEFLGFLQEWEDQCMATPNLTKQAKRRMCLSRETLEGLRLTVRSFVSLCKELLQEDGVQFVLSEKFTQDPLEEYFSKQRGLGGRCDNPTVQKFGTQALAIQIAGSQNVRASARGNCSNNNRDDETEMQFQLRRRQRRQ